MYTCLWLSLALHVCSMIPPQGYQTSGDAEDWGFYAHRLINRMAVFTLPQDLIGLYKKHIEYITAHAVDADKRRYATRYEAVRHYIDLEYWGTYPFEQVPRVWLDVMAEKVQFFCIGPDQDTSLMIERPEHPGIPIPPDGRVRYKALRHMLADTLLARYYDPEWETSCQELAGYFPDMPCHCVKVLVRENFSEHGILPYHLLHMQHRLTRAFVARDVDAILRLSADIGHYIGDAHVPLHTTKNYNGQLTGQIGIHAFWESRIPELFAESAYDFFAGKAKYIVDPVHFYWDVVFQSHLLVRDVLDEEMALRKTFPVDEQFCFDTRSETMIRTQCAAYAAAYQKAMQGMVEKRMRQAIHTIGSAWYTAWVDAGQPALATLEYRNTPQDTVQSLKRGVQQYGRKHTNQP